MLSMTHYFKNYNVWKPQQLMTGVVGITNISVLMMGIVNLNVYDSWILESDMQISKFQFHHYFPEITDKLFSEFLFFPFFIVLYHKNYCRLKWNCVTEKSWWTTNIHTFSPYIWHFWLALQRCGNCSTAVIICVLCWVRLPYTHMSDG